MQVHCMAGHDQQRLAFDDSWDDDEMRVWRLLHRSRLSFRGLCALMVDVACDLHDIESCSKRHDGDRVLLPALPGQTGAVALHHLALTCRFCHSSNSSCLDFQTFPALPCLHIF